MSDDDTAAQRSRGDAVDPLDPHDLGRFVRAQAPVHDAVRAELRAGSKRSHWMWFVFPQWRGLGRSETARRFGIASLDEARAFAAHPLLGARLREDCRVLLATPAGRSAEQIFGHPDDLKLCSSMTLFDAAVPDEPVFSAVLQRFCAGTRDQRTLQGLAES
ncbi:MAG: DUF1810 domain-containing protein [Rubrivivax sp.]